jgi:outer membrane protein OmpU
MKKVLLATTAVALSAGVAYAEVSFSGNARMGLQYTSDPAAGVAKTTLEKRMTVNIDATTESSSGITFGARMRLRSNENGGSTGFSGARVYLSTGGLEIGAGNIYGAIDSMPGMYNSEVGLTVLNDAGVVVNTVANPVGGGAWGFDAFSSNGNGAEGVEAIYTAGAFTGHLSYSGDQLRGGTTDAKRVAAYGAYTMNDWTVALGMQDSSDDNEDKTILIVGGNIGDYGVGFAAADNNGETKIALNGSATFGATTVNGFIADEESGDNLAIGLGVSYDLGGAAVVGGIEKDAVGTTRADFGVSFSF